MNLSTARSVTVAAASERAPILAVEGVRVTFPVGDRRTITAVDDISLDIREGETLGLVGESGCGKTTLGRAVLQLVRPSAGRVVFLGQDLTTLSGSALRAMRRHLQVVFQDPRGSLDPRMRVQQIVEEPLKVHKIGTGRERQQRVQTMLRQVGLDESHASRRPSELSGGQQQRVGIARALIAQPKLVVCDEAVSSLDVSIQAQVLNLLQELKQRLGVAYLFIAHNLAVVRHISDRIAVMYLGQVVEQAPAEQLFSRPLHPYTRALIASVLQPDLGARAHLSKTAQLISGDVPTLLAPPPGCRYHPRCPFARERCGQERPTFDMADDGHQVACHFWREIEADLMPPTPGSRSGPESGSKVVEEHA